MPRFGAPAARPGAQTQATPWPGPCATSQASNVWRTLNKKRIMFHKTTAASLSRLFILSLLAASCRDAVSPQPHAVRAPALASATGSGITLDKAVHRKIAARFPKVLAKLAE